MNGNIPKPSEIHVRNLHEANGIQPESKWQKQQTQRQVAAGRVIVDAMADSDGHPNGPDDYYRAVQEAKTAGRDVSFIENPDKDPQHAAINREAIRRAMLADDGGVPADGIVDAVTAEREVLMAEADQETRELMQRLAQAAKVAEQHLRAKANELGLNPKTTTVKELIDNNSGSQLNDLIGTDNTQAEQQPKQQPEQQSEPQPEPQPEPEFDPELFTAVAVDRTEDVRDRAFQVAQRRLQEELSVQPDDYITDRDGEIKLDKDGRPRIAFTKRVRRIVNGIWKGGVMRHYYETKYRHEALSDINSDEARSYGRQLASGEAKDDLTSGQRDCLTIIRRMSQDSDEFVRKEAGESRELLEADNPARAAIWALIQQYATADSDGKFAMSDAAFDAARRRLYADPDFSAAMGDTDNRIMVDNYLAIAQAVRGQVQHGASLESMQQQFRMYRAESRSALNTEAHRTKVESAIERFEHSKFGHILPSEVVAAAAGAAGYVASSLARSRAGQVVSFGGGAAVTGILAAMRVGNMTESDRAVAAQSTAAGLDTPDSKYNRAVAETVYETVPASDLMAQIDMAMQTADPDQMAAVLRSVKLRQILGDRYSIDLISYSAPDQVERESMDLLTARIDLTTALLQRQPDYDLDKLNDQINEAVAQVKDLTDQTLLSRSDMPDDVKEIIRDVQAKDRAFNALKHRRQLQRGLGAAAASLAFSAATRAAVDLIGDAITPDNVGDVTSPNTGVKAGSGDVDGGADADTLRVGDTEIKPGETTHVDADDLTSEQIDDLRAKGATVTPVHNQVDVDSMQTVDAEQAVANNPEVNRMGWFDNDTAAIDGNELAGQWQNGQMVYTPEGASVNGGNVVGGEQILQAARNGQMRLLLSPSDATQDRPFEVIGKVVNNQIVFEAEPGTPAAQMLADRSYRFAEVADASGMIYATDIGSGTANSFNINVSTPTDTITGYDIKLQ